MPLFRHIERNDIAMTSPVEKDYTSSGTTTLESTNMSFLYRTPDLHPTGNDPKDPRVQVYDTKPITVISLGGKGSYETGRVRKDVETLRAWLDVHQEWKVVGEPRALMYNGPSMTPWTKWLEVQIPVEPRQPAKAKPAGDS